MMKTFLKHILLSCILCGLSTHAAEEMLGTHEPLPPKSLSKKEFEGWDAQQAIQALPHFPGHIHRATYERLEKAWNTKDKNKRWLTLHTMLFHDMMKGHNTDGNVYMIINANRVWNNHFCNNELSYCQNHLLFPYETHYPVLQQYQQNFLAMMTHWPRTHAAILLGITDAQRGLHPLLMRSKYSILRSLQLAEEANRLWSNPEGNADFIRQTGLNSSKTKLRYLLHDYSVLFDANKEKGLTCWHYTWGKDLPQSIRLAMQLMQKRHQGQLPTPAEIQAISQEAAPLNGEMKAFTVRSMLAADPTCMPWKNLEDTAASLYEMPDCSAVLLPQWSDTLFGSNTSAEQDVARFRSIVQKEVQDKNFSTLLLFTLAEDALAQKDNAYRPWIPRDGHFRSYASFDIEVSENGIDVLIDEKGPRFSRDDDEMRRRYHTLTVALHRCALKMAIFDRDGKLEELGKTAAELAAVLNEYRAWPLMLNQYAMRQLSPRSIVALTAHCTHNQNMLRAWVDLVLKPRSMALTLAEHISTEKDGFGDAVLNAETLSMLIYELLVIRNKISPESDAEKEEILRKWIAYGKQYPKVNTLRAILNHHRMCDALFDTSLDPKKYRGPAAKLGYLMVRHAVERGEHDTARRIFKDMSANPVNFRYIATRLAAALIARLDHDEKAAKWHEKLAVSQAAIDYSLAAPESGQIEEALQVLLDAEKYTETERLQVLLPSRSRHFAREVLIPAFAANGQFESACFNAECLLTTLNGVAVSSGYRGSQAHLAQLRIEADVYRALAMLQQGREQDARRLLNTAIPAIARFPELGQHLIPCILHCDKIPQAEREQWRTQWLAAYNTPAPRYAAALRLLQATAVEDHPAVAERDHTPHANQDINAHLPFSSELYTWHLSQAAMQQDTSLSAEKEFATQAGRHATTQTIKARILKADYENKDEDQNKLWLQLESGRLLEIPLAEIATEDIENIIHWKEKNNIHTWTYHTNMSGASFDAKVERIVQSPKTSLKRTINRIPIVSFQNVHFIAPDGNRFTVYPDILNDESRTALAGYPIEETEFIRYFDSLPQAEAEATRRKTGIRVHMLGQRGGEEEALFNRQIKNDKSATRYVHAVAYQDAQGSWDSLGQEVMNILRENAERCNTQDVPAEDHIYRKGFVVELLSVDNPIVKEYVYSADTPDPQLKNDLFTAIRSNNMTKVEELLCTHPHLANMTCADTTSTPLHVALLGNCPVAMVELLLNRGSRMTRRSTDATPMLLCAVQSGRPKKLKLLLERGANPNVASPNSMGRGGYTYPLLYTRGNPELVSLLLQHGADPNACDERGNHLLYTMVDNQATWANIPQVARLLKEKGFNLNTRNHEGNSILRYMCRKAPSIFSHQKPEMQQKFLATMEELIKLGADVQEEENGKPTLLDYLKGKYQGFRQTMPQALTDLLVKYGAKES
ncbi:MAG: ankyrin repeat domain-containing protein [Akkermansia sp.]|nr:ankyrin repeat domain-containing protein [Akkermansia sp.]